MEVVVQKVPFTAQLDGKKRVTRNSVDYWMARDLQEILNYASWEKFRDLLVRARMACESAGVSPENQFHRTVKMVRIGSGAEREREDWYLTRYACYLVAMNGDSSKPEIGFAQTYFAVQTRRQEITDRFAVEEKRIALRQRVRIENRALASAAKRAGVSKFPVFQDEGYKGLYGGRGVAAIKAKKQIPANEDLLDCVGRAELAANEFRITQTEQKLEREQIVGEQAAIVAHHQVGADVRSAIKKIGGTMPEDLPPEPSIKKLLRDLKPPKLLS